MNESTEGKILELMTSMFTEFIKINSKLESMDNKIGTMDTKIENMNKEIKEVKETGNTTNKAVINLENKVIPKVDIIFETRQDLVDKLDLVSDKIDDLENKVEMQDLVLKVVRREQTKKRKAK